jgi:hypothetical protein
MAKVAQHGDYPFSKKDRDLLIQCMEKTNVCVAFGKMDRDILGDSVHDANLCEGFVRALYLQHIGIDKYLQYFQLLAVYFDQNIKLAFGVVLAYWIDFILKVAFGPEWSYIGRIGGWIVRKQRPEYVGAIQKRFAWSIGLVLSSIVLFLIGRNLLSESCANPILSGVSPCFVPMLICGVCLIFMWLETSAGICVGCHIYAWLAKRECINRGEYAPVCPGGVCDVKEP